MQKYLNTFKLGVTVCAKINCIIPVTVPFVPQQHGIHPTAALQRKENHILSCQYCQHTTYISLVMLEFLAHNIYQSSHVSIVSTQHILAQSCYNCQHTTYISLVMLELLAHNLCQSSHVRIVSTQHMLVQSCQYCQHTTYISLVMLELLAHNIYYIILTDIILFIMYQ